jgi:transcriptional regulator with XRE-family HTH domain
MNSSAKPFLYSLTIPSSSDTDGEFLQGDGYFAAMELRQRIFKARTDVNMTQEQLAAATGKTRGAVAQWESGDVRPRHSTIVLIAKATGKTVEWLESGLSDKAIGLNVVGEVAAGAWREARAQFAPVGQPVAADPRFPADAQRLYRVVGNSVNRVVPNGEYVHAVDVIAADIRPEPGDLVIVRKTAHGLYEYTAKRYVRDGRKILLRPESDDPEWQDDIVPFGDEDTSIEITDIVIAKWSPLLRSRS